MAKPDQQDFGNGGVKVNFEVRGSAVRPECPEKFAPDGAPTIQIKTAVLAAVFVSQRSKIII